MQKGSDIILGIDPGTLVMGYGIIAVDKGNITLLEMGVLQLSRYKNHPERLELIFRRMESLLKAYHPTAVAIEAPFFGKNVQSMLKLGRAQGVAIAAAMMHNLEAIEYAPRKVKQVITGRGSASKEQVWEMLQRILRFDNKPEFMDATDAVAVALCHYYQNRHQQPEIMAPAAKTPKSAKKSSWANFIAQNPGRLK